MKVAPPCHGNPRNLATVPRFAPLLGAALLAGLSATGGQETSEGQVNLVTMRLQLPELNVELKQECDLTKHSGVGGGTGWVEPKTKTSWSVSYNVNLVENAEAHLQLSLYLRFPALNQNKRRMDYEDIATSVTVPRNGKTSTKLAHGVVLEFNSVSRGPVQTKELEKAVANAKAHELGANLVLQVSCEGPAKFGDEPVVVFTIRNKSSTEAWNPRRLPWQLSLDVRDGSGKLPPPVDEFLNDTIVGEALLRESESISPGGSIERSRRLTRFAMIPAPETYQVIGLLLVENERVAASEPLLVRVLKRTDAEREDLVNKRIAELKDAPLLPRMKIESEEYVPIYDATLRLAITRDPKAIPVLVERVFSEYEDGAAAVRLRVFFGDRQEETKQAALALLKSAPSVRVKYDILRLAGATKEELVPVIAEQLRSDHPETRYLGALDAQNNPRSELVPMLAELARDAKARGRTTAIYALAKVGSPEALAVLRELQDDPDPSIRRDVRRALAASPVLPRPVASPSAKTTVD